MSPMIEDELRATLAAHAGDIRIVAATSKEAVVMMLWGMGVTFDWSGANAADHTRPGRNSHVFRNYPDA